MKKLYYGIGISKDLDLAKVQSLGLRMVTILEQDQLMGTITLERDHGTTFRITFTLKEYPFYLQNYTVS